MKLIKKIGFFGILLIIIITGIFWLKPDQPLEKGMIIATIVPSSIDLMKDDLGMDGRYISRSQIIAMDMNEVEKEPFLLSEGFYSARSPEVSYCGDFLVFSGQKTEGDIWQIFVMDLQSLQVSQISDCPVNCTDPAWLPDGRIAFSRLNKEETTGQIHTLYACEPDGANTTRLMYHPNSTIASSVSQDGRILVLSKQKYPVEGIRHMLALRIDGTKSELFYVSDHNTIPFSRAWEAADGQVYFVEKSNSEIPQSRLVSIAHGHPLSSYKNLSVNEQGIFHSLYPETTGQLIVSYRSAEDQPFGLFAFDTNNRRISHSIHMKDDYHIIEPVVLEERKVPMKLPIVVDETMDKGTLLCHNSDLSMISLDSETNGERKTEKVQVFGLNEMVGEVPVAEDGSFYIEIDANTPVRFQTVDADGEILRGPSAWIWVRPNERRSCIGCHEDNELAPDNKVPDALYNGIVSLPEGTRTEPIAFSGNNKDDE